MSANAEIIAELRRVLNERDEAREQLDLTKRELGRWVDREAKAVRERDEALARCETLRELADAAAHEQGLAQRRMMDAQRERDEARAELAALRKRVVEALPYPTDDDSDESRTAEEAIEMAVAERDAAHKSRDLAIKMWDEARAEADRWKRSCNMFRERDWPHAFQVTVTSLEREVSDAHVQLARLRRLSKPWEGDAYRRGAEAMREACARWVDHWVSGHVADKLRDMPIPEEP